MTDRLIRIKQYEQAADDKVSMGGIKWLQKWDVCIQCDSAEEAEALRAALAQPEQEIESDQDHVEDDGCPTEKSVLQRFWREHQMQEPVATLFGSLPVYDVSPKRRKPPTQDLSAPLTVNGVPMYPQREWQTLTDEEMFSLWVKCPAETEDRFAFARAIEIKLKAKNA